MGLDEPLGVDGQENFSLLFDDTTIKVDATLPGFQIRATLGPIPKEEQDILFVKLLRGNLFFQATAGSILGLDESGSQAILQHHYTTQPSYSEFKAVFEDFLNIVDFWKAEIREHAKNPLENY